MWCWCNDGKNGKDWIVVLIWLLTVLFVLVFFVCMGHSAEVCFSEGDAKRVVVELEQNGWKVWKYGIKYWDEVVDHVYI